MLRIWVAVLNFLSALEFRIADKAGDFAAVVFHFFLFWVLPIILLYVPLDFFPIVGIVLALFYIYLLAGDMFLSVFGHEELEQKRGMIDISNVQEIREEITGAMIKYFGGVISFATIYCGLQELLGGRAFSIPDPSSLPYVDFLYFSVVTIATVGYGDILATHWIAKAFVCGEIFFGLSFVLLIFTMLVSLYIDIQRKKTYDKDN